MANERNEMSEIARLLTNYGHKSWLIVKAERKADRRWTLEIVREDKLEAEEKWVETKENPEEKSELDHYLEAMNEYGDEAMKKVTAQVENELATKKAGGRDDNK